MKKNYFTMIGTLFAGGALAMGLAAKITPLNNVRLTDKSVNICLETPSYAYTMEAATRFDSLAIIHFTPKPAFMPAFIHTSTSAPE